MTEEQIIEALERCSQHRECCYCNSLEECGSKRVLTVSALELINHQQAEIERLKAEAEMAEGYEDALVERTKIEAIKEFAERLKTYCAFDRGFAVMPDDVIDNLVKEMVGDE